MVYIYFGIYIYVHVYECPGFRHLVITDAFNHHLCVCMQLIAAAYTFYTFYNYIYNIICYWRRLI